MLRQCLLILLTFVTIITYSQKSQLYVNGNIKTLPYVQLYLGTGNNFQLKIFTKDTLRWQGYNGTYKIVKDSLYLHYQQLFAKPVCRVVDTFHKERIINLLYINEERKVIDTFSWQCSNEPILIDYFPLTYRDTSVSNTNNNNVTYTYYVPDFPDEMNVLFYKPKPKVQSFDLAFKMEKDRLIVDPNYKSLLEGYGELLVKQ